MTTKGKSRNRAARRDLLRSNAKNAARKARLRARAYDRKAYDGHGDEEE